VIDHSTTTKEAATRKREAIGQRARVCLPLGQPRPIGAAPSRIRKLFPQTTPTGSQGLRGAGNIVIFNNGWRRTGGASLAWTRSCAVDRKGQYSCTQASPTAGRAGVELPRHRRTDSSLVPSPAAIAAQGNHVICSGANGTLLRGNGEEWNVWNYLNLGAGIPTPGSSLAPKLAKLVPGPGSTSLELSPSHGETERLTGDTAGQGDKILTDRPEEAGRRRRAWGLAPLPQPARSCRPALRTRAEVDRRAAGAGWPPCRRTAEAELDKVLDREAEEAVQEIGTRIGGPPRGFGPPGGGIRPAAVAVGIFRPRRYPPDYVEAKGRD